MDQQQLRALEYRCIQEEPPFCTAACPIHVDVRAFMAALTKGDIAGARKVLDRTMPFADIVGRLCDAPCQAACKRAEAGDPLAIGALEHFCVSQSKALIKLPKLPAKGGSAAIFGAGLSGMTAALDLARKGRAVTLYTAQPTLGGTLRALVPDTLPADSLTQAQALLAEYGATIKAATPLDPGTIPTLAAAFDTVYCDPDEIAVQTLAGVTNTPDPLTLAAGPEGWFVGSTGGSGASVIQQVADGRRAALSMERFLQKVSLTAQREKEGPFATRMYTVVAGIAPATMLRPADPAAGYTAEEARGEAGRCLQCECLECVKQCVYLQAYKEYPKTLVRKIYNNQAIVQGTRNANKMINACSLCGQCTVICPNDFPVADVCRATRQEMVATNHMPPSPHDFALEEMRFSLSEACRLSRHQPGHQASRFLFYPGCQLSGSAPEAVRRTYALLAGQLEGGVGLVLGCCGIPAHWAGQEALFATTMEALVTEVAALGNPTLIVACSSCLSIFKEFAPGLRVSSLWEVLDGLHLPAPAPQPLPGPLSLHDPCTARHQPALRDSVRRLCAKLGLPVTEAGLGGELADCCGYGGLMQFANQPLGRQAAENKARRSEVPTGAGLAYCAMCRDNLAATGRPVAHLLDYLLARPDDPDPLGRSNPGFSWRHEQRARLKRDLLAELWQETALPRPGHTDIVLLIDQEVRDRLNSRMLLEEDLQKVIEFAEASGRYLINPTNSRRLASHRPLRVTYWVEYEPTDQGYRIHNGYSHRMQLPEAQS